MHRTLLPELQCRNSLPSTARRTRLEIFATSSVSNTFPQGYTLNHISKLWAYLPFSSSLLLRSSQRWEHWLVLRYGHQILFCLWAEGHRSLWFYPASRADHPHSFRDLVGPEAHHGVRSWPPILVADGHMLLIQQPIKRFFLSLSLVSLDVFNACIWGFVAI